MNRAEEYLDRAGEAERMADNMTDPASRRHLLEIAAAWRALSAHTGRLGRRTDGLASEERAIPKDPED